MVPLTVPGKKSTLAFHKAQFLGSLLLNLFLCDLLAIYENNDFTSYADDTILYVVGKNTEAVLFELNEIVEMLFIWFHNNQSNEINS